MRVLHVYRDHVSVIPGGIERHVHDLARATAADESVALLAAGRRLRPARFRDGEVDVRLTAELRRVRGLPLSPGLPVAMRRSAADLLHLHCPDPIGELGRLLAGGAIPAVATYHCDPVVLRRSRPLYEAVLDRILASCRRVIASSEALVERSAVLGRLAARRPGALRVVPFGVDVQRFSPGPTPRSRALRESWGGRPVVLFVGRLRHYKGLPVLLQALRGLDASLIVVGDGPEGPRVAGLGAALLGSRLRMLGPVPDGALADHYRACDVLCLPSTSAAEAFGLSAVEAMACGRPVITTDVGTATSIVNAHGRTGLVVPPRDAEALRQALARILASPGLAAAMGAAARRRACSRYDLSTMARRVVAVHRDAVG